MRHRFPTPLVSVLLLLLSSIFLLSSISSSFVKAEVITLTGDTFNDKVQEKDTAWFVKFCVPWCKHCKNLGTLWEDLGKEMEGEDEIEIGEVDCATEKPVCSKVDIHSYPTFKLFYNGEEFAKYQGARDVESLKTFVLQETEKAATKAQLDNDGELFTDFYSIDLLNSTAEDGHAAAVWMSTTTHRAHPGKYTMAMLYTCFFVPNTLLLLK